MTRRIRCLSRIVALLANSIFPVRANETRVTEMRQRLESLANRGMTEPIEVFDIVHDVLSRVESACGGMMEAYDACRRAVASASESTTSSDLRKMVELFTKFQGFAVEYRDALKVHRELVAAQLRATINASSAELVLKNTEQSFLICSRWSRAAIEFGEDGLRCLKLRIKGSHAEDQLRSVVSSMERYDTMQQALISASIQKRQKMDRELLR